MEGGALVSLRIMRGGAPPSKKRPLTPAITFLKEDG